MRTHMAWRSIEEIKRLLKAYHKNFQDLHCKIQAPTAMLRAEQHRQAYDNQARLTYYVMRKIEALVSSEATEATEATDGILKITINGDVPKKMACVDSDGAETVFVREADVAGIYLKRCYDRDCQALYDSWK